MDTTAQTRRSDYSSLLRSGAAIGVLVVAVVLAWPHRQEILGLLQDQGRLRAYVIGLGWLGPFALIAINVVQIVIAPIPGYGVYIVAGYLFGWFWGGVWGTAGMLLGAMLAMWITRSYGRPFVTRMIGQERLSRWEQVTHSDSTIVWGLILLSPIGDTPYLLAGLARVGFLKILVLTIITRMPAAFAASALGAGAFTLTWWQLLIVVAVFGGPLLLFTRYQERITEWFRRKIQPYLANS